MRTKLKDEIWEKIAIELNYSNGLCSMCGALQKPLTVLCLPSACPLPVLRLPCVQCAAGLKRYACRVWLYYSSPMASLVLTDSFEKLPDETIREQWPLFSSYSCWQQLVTQTKNLSRDHAALSEVYSTHLVGRLAQVMEDVQRIYRRCREIGYETHEEILRVLHELHTTMKTYHSYQGEYKQAETKLRVAENQRLKLEQSLAREKLDRSKKYKLIEKEVQKRKNKYNDAKLKALKARNEYMLCLEASNSTIHKYFVEDLSDLIDCMDFGFHNCVSRALLMHVSAEEGAMKSAQAGLDQMTNCVGSLDSRLDKQRFLEFNHTAFMIPKKFEFQGQKDEGPETELQKSLRDELESRLSQLQSRVMSLRTESEEVWKTLETAETTLLDMLNAKDYDCSMYFGDTALPSNKPPETVSIKLRADRQETEEFYLTKFREYLLGTSRIARLDAKHEFIRLTLLDAAGDSPTSLKGLHRTGQVAKPPRRKRIGRLQMNGQPKLFGGSLEEYLEATNQEIPLIMKSCIRVINLYGLHHQGIFRVSGSQVEINNFRESFERGEDPLADMTDASDINSVGGVLKLYLRELREPLFPIIYFEHFMELARIEKVEFRGSEPAFVWRECGKPNRENHPSSPDQDFNLDLPVPGSLAQHKTSVLANYTIKACHANIELESKQDFVVKMKDLVQSLSRSVVVVMRYLFAFLNHLSEFSDENMMDPYNLAICFGPTLVPVPEDKDQVQYQNQVNELIKNIILFYEEIFPFDGGLMYEKYISGEPDETIICPESEFHEATAQFDFSARSERELSFKKGDNIILFSQVSNDWWKGSLNEQEGLVPDKYIMLKIKDEERDKLELLKSSSSEESMRRRASSSNDSILSSNTSSSAHNSPVTNVASATWPDPELTRRSLVAEPSPLIAVPTQEKETSSLSPKLTSRRTLSLGESGAEILGGGVMGAVEAALNTAQRLATAALQAESRVYEEDGLSVFLDNLPGDVEEHSRPDTPASSCSEGDVGEVREGTPPSRKSHWKSQSVSEVGIIRQEDETPVECKLQPKSRVVAKADSFAEPAWAFFKILGSSPKETGGGKKSLSTTSLTSLSSSSSSGEEETPPASENVISPTGPESPDMTTAAERFAKQNQCTLKKNTKASHGASIDAQTQTIKAATKRAKFAANESSSNITVQKLSSEMKTTDDNDNTKPSSEVVVLNQTTTEPEIVPIRSPGPHRTAQKAVPKFGSATLMTGANPVSSFKPQVKAKPQLLRKPVLPVPHPHFTQPSPELGRKDKAQEQVN
uniref:Uncharacterized protein n=1 Tax=Timema douglasi TaxID=61478 RepID=A0A7R8Z5E6_TIMDO|nr:unnamed protein product [Timema douglasi]